MADGAADVGDAGRRILAAAARCRGRPHPLGPCAGNVRRPGRAVTGGVAGAGAPPPGGGGYSPPAPGVGPPPPNPPPSPPAPFSPPDPPTSSAAPGYPPAVGRSAGFS